MKDLIRNSIYQGKNALREISFTFWTLIYPIILVSFFNLAFSGLMNPELEDINVGIEKDNPIYFILETIDILNIKEVSKEDINISLENKDIDGFIDNSLDVSVSYSGINQSIIKEIVEQIKQMGYLNVPIENYDFTVDYIKDNNQEANGILIIFYSLIAMVSTYGLFGGLEIASLAQGNLSNLGARLNVTPLRKGNFILSGVIVSLFLNLLANGLLLLYIEFILQISLFTELKYSLVFIILGNLFGVALGIFIGASNRQNYGVKNMIAIAIILFLSFLSGMMSPDIKVMLDENIPILNKINPISIITNTLCRVNLLESTKDIEQGIIVLIAYGLLLIIGSYMFLRRRNYDSI